MKWLIGLMDQEGICKMLGFTVSPNLAPLKSYRDRIIPSNEDHGLMDVSEYAGHLRKIFQAEPAWAGIGEVGGSFVVDGKPIGGPRQEKCKTWTGVYRCGFGEGRLPADHPDLLPVYDVAAEFGKVVMTHPLMESGPQRNLLEWPLTRSLERALSHNRKTQFLVHGVILPARYRLYMGNLTYEEWYAWWRTLLDRHPNLFFDSSPFTSPHMGWDPEFFLDQRRTAEEIRTHSHEVLSRSPDYFLNHMKDEAHFQWHVDLALKEFGPLWLSYPDRFMLGVDIDYSDEPCRVPWLCNEQVIRTYWRFVRAVLGRLPPEVAEKIAYKNAERLYGSPGRRSGGG